MERERKIANKALTRIFDHGQKYLVCKCGHIEGPFPKDTCFAGPGGELPCPECSKYLRNRGIEVYGSVISVGCEELQRLKNAKDWATEFTEIVRERFDEMMRERVKQK